MNNFDTANDTFKNVFNIDKGIYKLKAGIKLAILNFLKEDFVESRKYLSAVSNIQEAIYSNLKNEKVYYNYLLLLLNWHEVRYSDGFKRKVNETFFVIGDSHIASLSLNLKNRIVEKNFQFISYINRACIFFPEFNLIKRKTFEIYAGCDDDYFQKIKRTLSIEKNSIIIIGGRFPLYISNYHFDNQEGGIEGNQYGKKYVPVGNYDNIQKSFQNEVSELSKDNKIILIYPIHSSFYFNLKIICNN